MGASGSDARNELNQVERSLKQIESQIESLLHRQSQLQETRERLQRIVASETRAPRADWSGGTFPWDATMNNLLHSVFHLSSWRPLQREVINATMQGRDVICLMPSGGGKSLCYQLPALAAPPGSVTLVVSPLLALIVDQVAHLRKLNIASAALTSLSSKEEVSEVLKSLDTAETSPRLLYVTPERIASSKRLMSKLEKLYKAGRFFRVAVDESHCASQYGNDFRPDYKKLGVLRQQFPQTAILALTATATTSVCADVTSILRIDGAEIFRNSVDRPNLFYEVKPKPAGAAELADDIAGWITSNFPCGSSGICYCLTRKDTETLAADLSQRGIACAAYHADMDPHTRMQVHTAWAEGTLQVIAATISFGMGVSKASVRFVVHHSMSKSVENYYQESGRAGRDGLPAHCRLYYRFGDYLRQASVVSMETAWEPHLRGMLKYASAEGCRRAVICRHFAEAPAQCRGMCDWCKTSSSGAHAGGSNSNRPQDVSEEAAGALGVLQSWPAVDKRATLVQLIDKCKVGGKKAVAKELDRDGCERMIEAMVAADVLKLDFGFTAYSTNVYLKVGPKAAIVQAGRAAVCLPSVPPRTADSDRAIKPERTERRGHAEDQKAQKGDGGIGGASGSGANGSGSGSLSAAFARRSLPQQVQRVVDKGEDTIKPPSKKRAAQPVVVDLVDSDDDDFVLPAKR